MQKKKLALLSGLLLTACAQIEHKPSPAEPATHAFTSELWQVETDGCNGLGYYKALSQMTLDEKKQVLSTLNASLESQGNSCGQLELALVLSQPNSDIQNDSKANKLLAEFLDNPSNGREQDRTLASMLRGVNQERLRLKKVQKTLRRKLKQEQNASAALEKQLQELTSQLEQLKSLEQDINQQEQDISAPQKDEAVDEK